MHDELPEGLPPVVREVLAIFDEALTDVRFGDLDADRLREVAAQVRVAEREVEEARDRLDAAKRVHDAELTGLSQLAQRALAYARIYAEADPALAERLEPLVDAEKPPKRRRRRKAKAAPEVEAEELPFETAPLKAVS